MAKIKTFFHRGCYETFIWKIDSGMRSNKVKEHEKRNNEYIKSNMDLSDKKDNEINEFIKDKKVINITTTAQSSGIATDGYVTTVLYEDE